MEDSFMTVAFDGRKAAADTGAEGMLCRGTIVSFARRYPGCTVDVYITSGKPSPLLEEVSGLPNVNICRVGSFRSGIRPLSSGRALAAELLRRKTDVFHGLDGVLPESLDGLHGIMKVVTVNDLSFVSDPDSCGWIRRHISNLHSRHACLAADRIITPLVASAADVVKYYFVPKLRVSCACPYGAVNVPGGFSGDFLETLRAEYGLPEKFVIADCGAGTGAWLAGAAVSLGAEILQIGCRRRRIPGVRRISPAGITEAAAIIGLSQAYLCLAAEPGLQSRMHILCAMHSGVPVLAGPDPSLKELAGDAAVYADPCDCAGTGNVLHSVLSDARLRAAMSRKGRERVSSFTPDSLAEHLMSVYMDTLA